MKTSRIVLFAIATALAFNISCNDTLADLELLDMVAAVEPLRRVQAQPFPSEAEPAPESDPAPLQCYEAGRERTLLNEYQVQQLCLSSTSPTGPVECYVAADDRLFRSELQNIQFCRCALSARAVDCFERAQRETFLSDEDIDRLCAPVYARALQSNCRPLYGPPIYAPRRY